MHAGEIANKANLCVPTIFPYRMIAAGPDSHHPYSFAQRRAHYPHRIVENPRRWALFLTFRGPNLRPVQRLFSMFPTGTAGAALLLLRASVATTLIVNGTAQWPLHTSFWTPLVFLLPAFSLFTGFLTPCGSILACLLQLVVLLMTGGSNSFPIAIAICNGVAVALLGPGAYSMDAWLFGRHRFDIPLRREPTPDSEAPGAAADASPAPPRRPLAKRAGGSQNG
jgi:hypothetical protein